MVELTHPAAPPPAQPRSRGRFSGGRLALEIVAGALVGSLASYGTYKALCKHGASDCVGGVLAAVSVNFAVTPLVEYGVGAALGGRGSLGWTYLGGTVGFSGEGVPPAARLAVAVIILPITSGFFYELSSNKRSVPPITVTPVVGRAGAMAAWSGVF